MTIRQSNMVFCVLGLAVAVSGSQVSGFTQIKQPVAGESNLKNATTEVAKQQVAIAKKALSTIEQLQSAGVLGKLDESYETWQRRLIESLNKGGGNEAEYLAALKKYVEFAKLKLNATEALFKDGKVNQTQLYDVQYQALDAQAWLAESLTE